ncbi:MAG TPA: hypothetical protein VFQ60_03525 [Patescibacteria group bacterium]|nr:hypothetical protein [Patescibacteria group bacterium]
MTLVEVRALVAVASFLSTPTPDRLRSLTAQLLRTALRGHHESEVIKSLSTIAHLLRRRTGQSGNLKAHFPESFASLDQERFDSALLLKKEVDKLRAFFVGLEKERMRVALQTLGLPVRSDWTENLNTLTEKCELLIEEARTWAEELMAANITTECGLSEHTEIGTLALVHRRIEQQYAMIRTEIERSRKAAVA